MRTGLAMMLVGVLIVGGASCARIDGARGHGEDARQTHAAPRAEMDTRVEPSRAQASEQRESVPVAAEVWMQALPGIEVHRGLRRVRFSGSVPIDLQRTPRTFLEVLVCCKDTREHESLVVTEVAASQVHAALLMVGLEPGAPGSWRFENKTLVPTPPRGPRVRVLVRPAGASEAQDITAWVVSGRDQARLTSVGGAHFVFAGSVFKPARKDARGGAIPAVYGADVDGTLVGLTAFGSELIAWSQMYTPEAALDEPQWIADAERVPAFGTAVTVEIGVEMGAE
jgi:hypothetical protein